MYDINLKIWCGQTYDINLCPLISMTHIKKVIPNKVIKQKSKWHIDGLKRKIDRFFF